MKERPILFSGPMVNAIRDRRKTQTRRMVKPQPPIGCSYSINGRMTHALCFANGPEPFSVLWVPPTPKSTDHRLPCPYGEPGDRLWVKETHRFDGLDPKIAIRDRRIDEISYRADMLGDRSISDCPWRPSIFMPRWASRILLEITAVWVERLQDIMEEDAKAEGATQMARLGDAYATTRIGSAFEGSSFRDGYRFIWEAINGPGSWEVNPWVWVIEFAALEGGNP